MAMAFAVGSISGCHLNPAVSFGLAVGGLFAWRDLLPYLLAQVLGAAGGAAIIRMIIEGKADFVASDFAASGSFACNGYGVHSREGYGMGPVFLCELVMAVFLVLVVLGLTNRKARFASRTARADRTFKQSSTVQGD